MATACVFSIDDAYVMPFQVFFHSLESTGSIPIFTPIFILHTNSLCLSSIATLRSFLASYDREVKFMDATGLIPVDLPIHSGDHVSYATFYRLFIAEILPSQIERAIYLDADMLALRSIKSLFTEPIKEMVAATDHCSPREGMRLWGDQGGSYFQAGLLVIPLQKWRDEKLSERFLQVVNTERDRVQWWDQDVLNIALANCWQRLSVWYNACESVICQFSAEDLEMNAKIIHFSGSSKPWNSFNPSPFTKHWDLAYEEVFRKPFDRTPFVPPRPSLMSRLVRAFQSRLAGLILGRT